MLASSVKQLVVHQEPWARRSKVIAAIKITDTWNMVAVIYAVYETQDVVLQRNLDWFPIRLTFYTEPGKIMIRWYCRNLIRRAELQISWSPMTFATVLQYRWYVWISEKQSWLYVGVKRNTEDEILFGTALLHWTCEDALTNTQAALRASRGLLGVLTERLLLM